MDIALEQVHHGEVRGGFPVGDRGTLQHAPALGAMGMHELIQQTGLSNTGLSDGCDHLAASSSCLLQRVMESSDFHVPSYKRGESSGHGCLQASSDGTGTR